MSFEIVELGAGDAAAMASLHAQSFDAPWSQKSFADLGGQKSSRAYGLYADDKSGDLRGFIFLQASEAQWEILTLAVAPKARRQGLAKRLIERAEQAAFETAQGTSLWLEVAADNHAALALYLGCDFIENGRRKAYYKRAGQKRVDALLMHKMKEQG